MGVMAYKPGASATGSAGITHPIQGLPISEHAYTFIRMPQTDTRPFTPEPLAVFLTWTTYGSWLPGDDRGWVDRHGQRHDRNVTLARHATLLMRGHPVVLTGVQRKVVEVAITSLCEARKWPIHAVACRSNHVHVVITVHECDPARVLAGIKAWCSRTLSVGARREGRWWTKGGSARRLYDRHAVDATVRYVIEGQDRA